MDTKLPARQLTLAELIRLAKQIRRESNRSQMRGAILEWQSLPLRVKASEVLTRLRPR